MLIRFTLFLFVLCFSFNYSFAQSKDLIEKVKGLIQTSKNSPKVSTGIQSIINAENEIIKRSKKTELHKMIRSGLEEQKKKSKQKEILLDSLKSKNNGLEVVLDSLKNVQDQFTQLKFTQNDLSLVLLQKSYKLQEELLHLIDARHPQNPVAETLKKTINPSSKYYQEQNIFLTLDSTSHIKEVNDKGEALIFSKGQIKSFAYNELAPQIRAELNNAIFAAISYRHYLIVYIKDNKLVLYKYNTEIKREISNYQQVTSAVISPNGNYILASDEEKKEVFLIDLKENSYSVSTVETFPKRKNIRVLPSSNDKCVVVQTDNFLFAFEISKANKNSGLKHDRKNDKAVLNNQYDIQIHDSEIHLLIPARKIRRHNLSVPMTGGGGDRSEKKISSKQQDLELYKITANKKYILGIKDNKIYRAKYDGTIKGSNLEFELIYETIPGSKIDFKALSPKDQLIAFTLSNNPNELIIYNIEENITSDKLLHNSNISDVKINVRGHIVVLTLDQLLTFWHKKGMITDPTPLTTLSYIGTYIPAKKWLSVERSETKAYYADYLKRNKTILSKRFGLDERIYDEIIEELNKH